MSSSLRARLEIVRNHPQDIQDRPVYLWVDGETWDGVLRYGATFTRELCRHTVKVHNTLSGHAVDFDAASGETVR